MDRKLASVQKVVSVRPIDGADRIECATVLGWECVVKKDDNIKPGDLVVYIEVDSILPVKPEFEFLADTHYRIKTRKFKKQVSQGLILPLSYLPATNKTRYEGDDVTEVMGIKKYDPQGELEQRQMDEKAATSKNKVQRFLLKFPWYRKLFRFLLPKRTGFPTFIRKTDETRLQAIPHVLEQYGNQHFYITEKLDGQSATYFVVKKKPFLWFDRGYEFGVCSRNYYLPKPDNSTWWRIVGQYNLKKELEDLAKDLKLEYLVLQGEIIGEGIQGNKYGIKGLEFYAFNLITERGPFSQNIMDIILSNTKIDSVPVLANGMAILCETVPEMVEMARGKSKLADIQREGIVVRNYAKDISFKVINPDFLLKYNE